MRADTFALLQLDHGVEEARAGALRGQHSTPDGAWAARSSTPTSRTSWP
ncbi:hypothetical protein [Serinicoccus sp. CUA-874]|nr:hypothetical protein [Serinicoccus sp. CUA-874]